MHRRDKVKDVLWVLATVGLVAAIMRFARGLGATTALNDATPWGLWVAFDVLAGVALAAGGFVIASTVYVLHLEKYRPILRPAVLTAFLGYGAVIVGLLCDLGLPWHIWKPMVHWQHHSVLFEVAWCVMLYFTVLALEFSPVILEHPWFQHPLFRQIAQLLKRLTLPLVIAGVILSTLHQSSLGSLFLIMPLRLHPLWYSPLLPALFFVSAVGLGLMMVTLEAFLSVSPYQHRPRMDLLAGLGKAAAGVLWLYLALRLGDLAVRGVLSEVWSGSWQGVLFVVEVLVSTFLPALLLSFRAVRTSPLGLGTGAVLTVGGMILNRLSVGVIAMQRPPGTSYFPTWTELAISLGIVAAAGLVFLFFAERLSVFAEEEAAEAEHPSPYTRPVFDLSTQVYLDPSLRQTVARRSLAFVVAAALVAAVIPSRVVTGQEPPRTPVAEARGWDVLCIDGDRDGRWVLFDHRDHEEIVKSRLAGQSACRQCHHLSQPHDGPTACAECHRDMHLPTSIFDHKLHQQRLQGNASCGECHEGRHAADTAKPCGECHEDLKPTRPGEAFKAVAVSYEEAMHGQCIGCHKEPDRWSVGHRHRDTPPIERCPACHGAREERRGGKGKEK